MIELSSNDLRPPLAVVCGGWAAELSDQGKRVHLRCPDGTSLSLAADLLWRECPSARGRRRRIDDPWGAAPPGISVTRLNPVGLYGVNIAFSDGHDRGIFPWVFLAALARRPEVNDFIAGAEEGVAATSRNET